MSPSIEKMPSVKISLRRALPARLELLLEVGHVGVLCRPACLTLGDRFGEANRIDDGRRDSRLVGDHDVRPLKYRWGRVPRWRSSS